MTMASPATNTFQSAVGPVNVTVTGHPETGLPHMVHFATDAGLCAHFLVREWNQLNTHLADLIHAGKDAEKVVADVETLVPPQRQTPDDPEPTGQPAPVSPDQPFLPPTAEAPKEGESA